MLLLNLVLASSLWAARLNAGDEAIIPQPLAVLLRKLLCTGHNACQSMRMCFLHRIHLFSMFTNMLEPYNLAAHAPRL